MTSSMHFYLNWAKERIDEMDAILGSLEGRITEITTDSQAKAEQLIVDLRTKRDQFQDNMNRQAEAGEAAWTDAKAKLESDWNNFQVGVKRYLDGFGEQFRQQQETFQDVAAAQLHAWREAADKIHSASAGFAIERRARIDAAVEQMKEHASSAEANFQKLTKAGAQSWSAWSAALAESRAAFDRANQTAWEAFKKAG
jgi:hypothetical protein